MSKNTKCYVTIRLLLVLIGVISTFAASAADTIKVNPIAQYANESVGNQNVRNQCDWNERLIKHLVKASRGRVAITNADLSTVPGKTLKIVIISVHAAGGGGFSGPKWGYIRATLMDGGEVTQEFEMGSRSNGSTHATACGVLNKIAKALGVKAAKQLATSAKQGAAHN